MDSGSEIPRWHGSPSLRPPPLPSRPAALNETEARELTGKEWRAVPFGEVRIAHGFPREHEPLNQTITVYVDEKPVARLAVTEIGFQRSYGNTIGHVTLKMVAGDCLILASRPKLSHDAEATFPQPAQLP